MHLAEVNIGRLLHDPDDERVRGFFDALDRILALAERSPGFVWRLRDEDDHEDGFGCRIDTRRISNVSVWQSRETLEQFLWRTAHKRIYDRGPEWFERSAVPNFALWWVPVGHRPTSVEAAERLEMLRTRGPTVDAFDWNDLAGKPAS